MDKQLLFLVVLAAVVCRTTEALSVGEERIKGCLDDVERELKSLVIPEQVQQLGAMIRERNAYLAEQHSSLLWLISDKRADLDIQRKEPPAKGEQDQLFQSCSEFMTKVMHEAGATRCGKELIWIMNPHNPQHAELMDPSSRLTEIMGLRLACTKI